MSNNIEREPGRVSKREFMRRSARRAGLNVEVMNMVWDAMLEELIDITSKGDSVTMTGFGRFYPQMHKGHIVNRPDEKPGVSVDDYTVLKFSSTRETNKRLSPSTSARENAEV